tara:strand:+ start:158 stop:481 length:324 start_codon:yes stop_codon:yes gene_type:complete
MANLDHEAIRKAYPEAVKVDDDTGAFKLDGTQITLVQSDIDAARVELDKLNYQKQRTGDDNETTDTIYPDLGEQFDLLFKDIAAGTLTTSGNLYTALKAVKDKYPKS